MNMAPLCSPERSAIRSFDGCWTCRLRRKKCDERRPVCGTCDTLYITCHYSHEKPEWMDGGVRQKEMADQIKAEVKESADRRRWKRVIHAFGSVPDTDTTITAGPVELSEQLPSDQPPWTNAAAASSTNGEAARAQVAIPNCWLETGNHSVNGTTLSQSDYILFSFYLEHLLPFLFPFYRPPALQGGKAWIMELMLNSPVMRQATLCQSSYFFSVIHGSSDCASLDALVGARTRDAFAMLRQSIQSIGDSDINEQLHDAARTLVSILQLQRFEVAIMSFQNCQPHLNAAVALFKRLMEDVGGVKAVGPRPAYDIVLRHLGPSTRILPTDNFQVPSAEQAAFSFASTLVILDDIITSTVSQEEPKLYEYHRHLLDDAGSPINAEAVVGCRNWILLGISEIARLDAWKQRCKRAGSLDMMELVRRASPIKSLLETGLARLDIEPVKSTRGVGVLLSIFLGNSGQGPVSLCQKTLAIPVWAHAALLYLFVVVSGWQPRSAEVAYHVTKILDILTNGVEPPGLLRAIVWPFCIAGFLAQPHDEWRFRKLVHDLQPLSVFGTARKALELMENIWRNRDAENSINFDLGTLFSSPGELILLV
ncbi:fungal-specific transcription factor domain-containing protein [Aspergillus pseudodeflectus]|uniref:Fungal-specific transcription factor domain-containing protein n=1 Tax=Aspergillus pseudodeflectus TaxID=176178 RepID=A0ABR4JI10_9EURO